MEQLKKQLNSLKKKVEEHEVRIIENSNRIEADERIIRQNNIRVYGFQYTKCKISQIIQTELMVSKLSRLDNCLTNYA